MGRRKKKNKQPASARSCFIAGVVFLAIALVPSAAFLIPAAKEYDARSSWAKVPCVVTKSEYELRQRRGRGAARSGGSRYFPLIEYSYEYDGVAYAGSKYKLHSQGFRGSNISVIHEKFPEGSTQICLVNPKNPPEAVLDAWTPEHLYGAAISLPFYFLAAAMFVYGFRKRGASELNTVEPFV